MKSTRSTPESRIQLGNDVLRLDFDPRTSDTMYNYIHIRRPDTGKWERPHNFGIDVRAPRSGGQHDELNLIGVNLEIAGCHCRAVCGSACDDRDTAAKDAAVAPKALVTYPHPLIQYRQFDDKIGSAQLVRQYPDFKNNELPALVHADGAVQFEYEVDASRPSFTICGKVLSGAIRNVVYIISALWTDNHALPTHEYVEGFPEFDIAAPQAVLCRELEVANVAYVIFYRHDGNGVPFALLPLEPVATSVVNFYDNWKCLEDFRLSCLNQQFIPEAPAIKGCNDTGYTAYPRGDGTLPGVRVAFFPELGWGRGGVGHVLRDRIVAAIRQDYWDAAASWGKPARHWPTMKLTSPLP
jgi:hypothetical protein